MRLVEEKIIETIDGIETLKHTIFYKYDDVLIDDVVVEKLIETKRLMPNGDYYFINGNIEQFVPAIKEIEKPTEFEILKAETEIIVIGLLGELGVI